MYSLNIFKGENFADFKVLGVINENFILKYLDCHIVLIHFGRVCKSSKNVHCSKILLSQNI